MLRVENLSKAYGSKSVLRDVSFVINAGEIVALLGPSGSGKTTLAKIIAKYEDPDDGQVFIDDKKLGRLKDNKGKVELISQHPYASFNPYKKLIASLSEGPIALGLVDKKNIDGYLAPFLKDLHINKALLFRYPEELSGGEIQKMAILRALSVKPKVIICDEIASSLDSISARELVETIKGLKGKGVAILFISHDIEMARYLSDRIVELSENSISPFSVF